jgi:hypothetical protein
VLLIQIILCALQLTGQALLCCNCQGGDLLVVPFMDACTDAERSLYLFSSVNDPAQVPLDKPLCTLCVT